MANPVRSWFLSASIYLIATHAGAQSYHAFNGSSYAGVTAMYINPASTVNQAYRWDVTLFGLQATLSNNAFVAKNSSLMQNSGGNIQLTNGLQSRYIHANADVNLLNARYNINSKNAVTFGFRLRTYNHIKTGPFNYSDTIHTLNDFLHANNNVNFLNGNITHAGWGELNFNYSHVIFQSALSSLSGGITMSYIRSLSGGYSVFSHLNYSETKDATGKYSYNFNQAAISAVYSDNYRISANSTGSSQNFQNFLSKAPSGFGLDIGAEYLIKNSLLSDDKEVDATNYDWKIGVSIMDIGRNRFNPIDGSLTGLNPLGVSDSVIQKKMQHVQNLRDVRDSLSTIFNTLNPVAKRFYISLPARLIINVDHNLGNHFFVNGEVSLNFYSTQPAATLHTRELNLLTLTPRWETQALGVYLPVQYNTQGQLWVGGAVKLGPLLLGVHNLDFVKWFKKGDQTYTGGGYILLSIHPFNHREPKISELDCPKN